MIRSGRNQNDLRITLDEIKGSGCCLSCNKSEDWLKDIFRDIKNVDFTFIDGISIQVEISRTGGNIFISGLVNTTVKMSCIKCLDDFDFPLVAEFHYSLCPSDERELAPEIEINKEDLNSLYFQGNNIDLIPFIREQILLNIPSYPLCRESCKGMCSQCGANLNHGLCQCDKKEVTISKFEILKNFYPKH